MRDYFQILILMLRSRCRAALLGFEDSFREMGCREVAE